MMVEHNGSDCGLCVNDPEDCSNIQCDACPADYEHVETGECCGSCTKTEIICEICPIGMML
jgi:hypothetical protein